MLSIVSNSSTKVQTMSSSQLAELLGMEKKEVNRKIREMFPDMVDGGAITPSFDARGYVTEYLLDELHSTMFVGKWHNPFLRQLAQYWIGRKATQPALPTTYLEALEKLIETEKEKIAITHERDEAIKTKALISDKKTATAMNTASRLSRENKILQSKLQDVGEYLSVIAAGLPQRVATELNDNAQTWRVLMKICKEMKLPPKKVKDERYGEVNTYHLSVIHKFKSDYLD